MAVRRAADRVVVRRAVVRVVGLLGGVPVVVRLAGVRVAAVVPVARRGSAVARWRVARRCASC